MRLEKQDVPLQDRLSDEELIALRARLHQARPQGPTVDSIAEALGRSREDVLAHLAQLRAERAVASVRTPAPLASLSSQRKLLALAGLLFVGAVIIFVLTPRRPSDEEIDAKNKEAIARSRKRRANIVHLPVVTKINKSPEADIGYSMAFLGSRSKTLIEPTRVHPVLSPAEFQKRLEDLFVRAYLATQQAEANAPVREFSHSLQDQRFYGVRSINRDTFFVSYGRMRFVPARLTDPDEVRKLAEAEYEGLTQRMWKYQYARYSQPLKNNTQDFYTSPFTVRLQGGRNMGMYPATDIVLLLPQSPSRLRLLTERAIRRGIEEVKAPIPGVARRIKELTRISISVDVPGKPLEFDIPASTRAGYANALDVTRAADRVIKQNMDELESRITRLNRSAGGNK